MSLEVPLSQQSRCAVHPEELAGGTCTRCGSFVCGACATVLPAMGPQVYCQACAARPELNYLEALRLRYWGKRDGTAWVVGLVTLGLCLLSVMVLGETGFTSQQELPWMLLSWAPVPVGVAYFLGKPWARHALVATPWVMALVASAVNWQGRIVFLLTAVLVSLFALNMHRATRTQLFFRVPVSSGKLRALWDLRFNNPLARQALNLGLGALFMPAFAPFAMICGAVALARVNPNATPPIGRKGQALAGVVLGAVSILLWSLVWLPVLSRFASNFVFHT
jgi:hypothetical protein